MIRQNQAEDGFNENIFAYAPTGKGKDTNLLDFMQARLKTRFIYIFFYVI